MNKTNKDKWIIEGLIRENSLNVMNVMHDNWCDFMKDKTKECNCEPIVKVKEIE